MDAISFKDAAKGRKLEDMSPNELRAKLINAGVDPYQANTMDELIALVRKYCSPFS